MGGEERVGREVCRCLHHIDGEALACLGGDHAQERDLQAPLGPVVARGPESIQAVGVLSTLSNKATVKDTDTGLLPRRSPLD